MTTKNRYAALGLTAGLVGGAAAGAVLGVPGLSGASQLVAQDDGDDTTDTTDDTTDTTEDSGETNDDGGDSVRPDRGERIRERLQDLVDDGTIDSDQADAVAEHLADQLPMGGRGDGHRHGPGGGHFGGPGFAGAAVAEALGIDVAELRDALRDGSTVAELAESYGVDLQAVVDALVAEASERLDTAIENGRLTQEEADEKLETLEERISERLSDSATDD